MLKIKGKFFTVFELEVSETDLPNVPKYIDFLVSGDSMPPPTPLAITIPQGEFAELTPVYRDIFGNICLGTDGKTPLPVVGPVFTPNNADTSITLLSDGNASIAELSTATSGEVTNISVVDANGLTGSIVVTEGPSPVNVPAFLDFNVVGISSSAPTS